MTRRKIRGSGGAPGLGPIKLGQAPGYMPGTSEQRGVVDHLHHREKTVRIRKKTHECCKDPSNLVAVLGADEYTYGRYVQVCKFCKRRHFTLRADPLKLHADVKPVGIVKPSRKTVKDLGL